MNTKLFVGLTFFPDNSFAKNIESFRARFDAKYQTNPYLHLPIVAPFEIEQGSMKQLKLELIEELESFFFETTANHSLKFTGIDVHEYKKNKILYLNPVIEDELSFCQESLLSICQSYTERDKRIRDSRKTFLTIGRYQEVFDLHSSIDHARREFLEFTSLPFESICLFSKNNGNWIREADLVSFEKPADTFAQEIVSL
jgi:hypothetical protein